MNAGSLRYQASPAHRLAASIGLAIVLGFALCAGARAQTKNVSITLDWIIQGTHAPFFVAREKGYFKAAGVTVDTIDPGNGATNVAVKVAGGAYQFGWVDLPSMILFNAKNPNAALIAVYMSFDESRSRSLPASPRESANPPISTAGRSPADRAPRCTTRHRSCSRPPMPGT
jgi:ABC-type nitrate/sulfonate/bicarbonate transport system substrate-binding protein